MNWDEQIKSLMKQAVNEKINKLKDELAAYYADTLKKELKKLHEKGLFNRVQATKYLGVTGPTFDKKYRPYLKSLKDNGNEMWPKALIDQYLKENSK